MKVNLGVTKIRRLLRSNHNLISEVFLLSKSDNFTYFLQKYFVIPTAVCT